jgi:prepilin-type N-terminal cleavage/methylation domain-containing protein
MLHSAITGYKKGFTLMEILVTIVMIALILPIAMKGISIATSVSSDSTRKLQAINLAENRLAEILIGKEWQNSSESGTFSGEYFQYKWQMNTSDWGEDNLKQIALKVLWDMRGRERSVILYTLIYDAD